jgi:hypothetical protein
MRSIAKQHPASYNTARPLAVLECRRVRQSFVAAQGQLVVMSNAATLVLMLIGLTTRDVSSINTSHGPVKRHAHAPMLNTGPSRL